MNQSLNGDPSFFESNNNSEVEIENTIEFLKTFLDNFKEACNVKIITQIVVSNINSKRKSNFIDSDKVLCLTTDHLEFVLAGPTQKKRYVCHYKSKSLEINSLPAQKQEWPILKNHLEKLIEELKSGKATIYWNKK